MKFLVDAQLPRRLCALFAERGFEAIHTLQLPAGNRTSDKDLALIAGREGAIIVTKDADFVTGRLQSGAPSKLLLVSTGNIGNDELIAVFAASIDRVVEAFQTHFYIELTREFVIVHE